MNTHKDGKILDPICDMVVDIAGQRAKSLTSTHAGREYAFCGPGCKKRFELDAAAYVAKVDAWLQN